MTHTFPQILARISELEDILVRQTSKADWRIQNVILLLHGDCSGRIIFKWTKNSSDTLQNLIDMVNFDDNELETQEDFDNLNELESYLFSG